MIIEQTKPEILLNTLIRQNRSFAIWRCPGSETRFVMQSSGAPVLYNSMQEPGNQRGFVIAPFHIDAQLPIVLIRPEHTQLTEALTQLPETEPATADTVSEAIDLIIPEAETFAAYRQTFDEFIAQLQNNRFEKLVLSRSQTIDRPAGFSPAEAFYAATARYTDSYVYLCHTPVTGTWIGCTPEIILSANQGEWKTVALAGTQALKAGKLPLQWDQKNMKEQDYVSWYIRTKLKEHGINPSESAPFSVRAGALSHLKTEFSFRLPPQTPIGALLQALHPTPAVCGLPKEEACDFILKHEGYNRRYYSGVIGWLDGETQTDLYVNLRCMQIRRQQLTLYAGGGLLASSELQSEWQETEAKMQTMLHVCHSDLTSGKQQQT